MVRTVVIPKNRNIQLSIPAEYVGRKVEVTYSLLDELNHQTQPKMMSDFWGILSDETARELSDGIYKSRSEWERDI